MKVGYQILADLQQQQAFKQWGLGSPSINFPIAFPKECFIAAITRAAGNYEHSIVITTKNKTNLSWICKGYDNSAGNTYANWLALGCQLQWGTNRTNGIYSFPIPFTEALCCFGGGEAGSGYYDNASAYSNTQVRVYSDGSSRFVSWIAIGA